MPKTFMGTMADARVGHMIQVNDRPVMISEIHDHPDGRRTLRWSWGGVTCKADGLLRITVPNARFCVYWNEQWTTLTLEPGESLTFKEAHSTDEGWSAEYQDYEYDDEEMVVKCQITRDGSDCDGRLTTYWDGECPVSELRSVPAEQTEYGDMPDRPEWRKVSASQRDYNAEAAGY